MTAIPLPPFPKGPFQAPDSLRQPGYLSKMMMCLMLWAASFLSLSSRQPPMSCSFCSSQGRQ